MNTIHTKVWSFEVDDIFLVFKNKTWLQQVCRYGFGGSQMPLWSVYFNGQQPAFTPGRLQSFVNSTTQGLKKYEKHFNFWQVLWWIKMCVWGGSKDCDFKNLPPLLSYIWLLNTILGIFISPPGQCPMKDSFRDLIVVT